MKSPSRHDRLRALLRDADPAADAPPLQAADLAHIRGAARAALAAPARSPSAWHPLAWAAMAAAVLLAIGLVVAGRREPATSAPRVAVAAATTRPSPPVATLSPATPPVAGAAVSVAPPPTSVATHAARHASPAAAPCAARRLVRRPAPPRFAGGETVASAAQSRQIQLTTPGGTRIVWVLESSPGR